MTQSLVKLVLDPFDDVRTAAANILSCLLNSVTDEEKNKTTRKFIEQSLRGAGDLLCRAQRADIADGYGRLNSIWFGICPDPGALILSLLAEVEHDLEIAKQDLVAAVASRPIHGRMIALK